MAHQMRTQDTDESVSPFLSSYEENLGRAVMVTFSNDVDIRADSGSMIRSSSQDGYLKASGKFSPIRHAGIIHFDRPPLFTGSKQVDGASMKSEAYLSDTSSLNDAEMDESGKWNSLSVSSSSSMTLTPVVTSHSESDDVNGDEEDNFPEDGNTGSLIAIQTVNHPSSRPGRTDTILDYRERLYPSSMIPEVNYPSNDYVTSPYPVYEFPDASFPSSHFPPSDFPAVNFPTSSLPTSQFPISKLLSSDFPISEFPSRDFPKF